MEVPWIPSDSVRYWERRPSFSYSPYVLVERERTSEAGSGTIWSSAKRRKNMKGRMRENNRREESRDWTCEKDDPEAAEKRELTT